MFSFCLCFTTTLYPLATASLSLLNQLFTLLFVFVLVVFGSRNIENMLFLIDYDLQIMQIISLRDEVSNQFKEWIKNISEHECYKKKTH